MTRPEPPPGPIIAGDRVEERADDFLHAEWLRLGAALAAFDCSVRGEHALERIPGRPDGLARLLAPR